MSEAKILLNEIGRGDISDINLNLLDSGAIDSVDIIALVGAMQARYGKDLDAKFLSAENFQSIAALDNMIKIAYGI
ncbi:MULTISPECIES: phosphopantetheine-binding protein [Campylobacter]|uniref:Phosphopantetheine-binding protein n=1 Tax=Campylobacter porcelli TaxID=1660073 RepID=A0ABU7M654_9BACT|nr:MULTISPECIES: phosphopantetheine-binding protein [unclassified Campylobacter]MCR8679748.1 phosphopantetheine-binding protein [Campylobacter sp. RM19072]MCR8696972.1 phosphopantetheine-binding protein [Campylobacter sp. RM19073]MEE3705413.1 phosphopantetheine-binding protein [Campylobacter sp. CX2-8023-23]MEE3745069.1 phosphopantetheine-binding protein [Campylobacter sp. CX2-4855-23]MEE3777042.1 phosphopantetheine-binding protein [Campylobacter sp. CX2-4080-23]